MKLWQNNNNDCNYKQTDHLISARWPDLVTVNKKKENLSNCRLWCPDRPPSENKRKLKERWISRTWNMKVTVIPVVVGVLGTIPKGLVKGLEDLEIRGQVETIQTTALLRLARILRRVLETWGNLLSLRLQCETISYCWCEKLSKV